MDLSVNMLRSTSSNALIEKEAAFEVFEPMEHCKERCQFRVRFHGVTKST